MLLFTTDDKSIRPNSKSFPVVDFTSVPGVVVTGVLIELRTTLSVTFMSKHILFMEGNWSNIIGYFN